jgi:hypothetical protein
MVGGRRRNPRARQGTDVKIGPAARNSFSRMQGSWLWIAGSRRIRGRVERHGLEPIAAFDPIVLPFEGDALLVERNETRIRDRDAVGVASEIGEDGLRSGEGSLGVDDPCDRESSGEENVEGRRHQACARGAEFASIGRVVLGGDRLPMLLRPATTMQSTRMPGTFTCRGGREPRSAMRSTWAMTMPGSEMPLRPTGQMLHSPARCATSTASPKASRTFATI